MNLHNKSAVVFDLDGTILDTIGDIAAAVNRAITAFGFKERTVAEVQSFLGNGSLVLIQRAIESEKPELCTTIRARFRKEYEHDMYSNTRAYCGIPELLSELKASGVKVIVVTNKDDRCAKPMIERYFGNSVDICRGVVADAERKPNPAVTLSVLSELGIDPSNAVFVGDGMADLRVSKNAGIDFVPVGYGYTSPEKLFSECGITPCANVQALRERLLEYIGVD